MRKISLLSALLSLCAISASAETFEYNNFYFDGDPDTGECVIYAINDYDLADENIVIPQTAYYEGDAYTVVGVDENAFRSCTWIESVVLPSTIRTIARSAFEGCYWMESINFPEGLESIAEFAFYDCESLQSVTLPASVTSIGDCAFWCCYELESVDMSQCVNLLQNEGDVGESVFCDCEAMSEMIFPPNALYIPNEFCSNCDGITELNFPQTVAYIGSCAFANMDGLLSVRTPMALKTLDYAAFGNDPAIETVILNPGLEYIEESSFEYDRAITMVYIPASVWFIGISCFDTLNMTDLYIDDMENWLNITTENLYSTPNFAAYDNIYLHMRSASVSPTTPFDATNFVTVTDLNIPDGITHIRPGALCNLEGITSLTIPEGVETIGQWAFSSLFDLPSLTIPNSVRSIGERAFWFNYVATDLVLGSEVRFIDRGAFEDWDELTTVTCLNPDVPTVGDIVFSDYRFATMTLRVPEGSIEAYTNDSFWGQFGTILPVVETGVKGTAYDAISIMADGSLMMNGYTGYVEVYDTTGRLVRSFKATCGDEYVKLEKGTVYIVKAGDKTLKIRP